MDSRQERTVPSRRGIHTKLAACVPVGQRVEIAGVDAVGGGVNPRQLLLVIHHELL